MMAPAAPNGVRNAEAITNHVDWRRQELNQREVGRVSQSEARETK